MITALIIFIVTYLFIGLRQIPRLHIDRPAGALAGNFTLIGSVANLIVVQQARKKVELGFMEYFCVGAIITVITISLGILVLVLEVGTAHGAEPVAAARQARTVTVQPNDPLALKRTFTIVLLCDTDEKKVTGLQGFRSLGMAEAALFVFEPPAVEAFWMGSVAYPIDIIFINANGIVVKVYPRCRPGSRDLLPSMKPVKWVLETAGGSGIKAGDRVSFQ